MYLLKHILGNTKRYEDDTSDLSMVDTSAFWEHLEVCLTCEFLRKQIHFY